MTTAGDIVERAFKRILVGGADAAPEPDEYADALADLNSFMLALEVDGIRLGYTVVDNVSDPVTIPPAAVLGVVSNLAITIAPDYGGVVSAALAAQATTGMGTLRKLSRPRMKTSYPGTLPTGSGNTGWDLDDDYYAPMISAQLSLAGNTLVTDIVTADTPVRVNAFWERPLAEGMRSDVYGRVTSTQDGMTVVSVLCSATATGDGAYTFRLMKNGVSVAAVSATLSATPVSATLSQAVTLYPADYLELWVEAGGHTNDLTITDGQVEVC